MYLFIYLSFTSLTKGGATKPSRAAPALLLWKGSERAGCSRPNGYKTKYYY